MASRDTTLESRVLVLAPTGRDAANSDAVLSKAGISCVACRDMAELCREIAAGAGAVLMTEEALSTKNMQSLVEVLARQPSWSDLPIALLTRGGPSSPAGVRAMEKIGNLILLERPVRVSTLLTAIRTALRMRQRQYQSREHLRALREADVRKDEFLAMLAHELRNPLAPIRNAMHVFQLAATQDENVQRARAIVGRQLQHLTRLVDDLLDVSRITRGKVELRRERVEVAMIVERAVEAVRSMFDARDQTLEVRLPQETVMIYADPTRLAQVITNLLHNASKYTDRGGHVWLEVDADSEIEIRVCDDGAGIAPEMLQSIFDLFIQSDSSLDRAQGGLGIGLTLVRSIVQMHGGSVQASSPGLRRGSRFVVRLPRSQMAVPAESALPGGSPSAAMPRRVLVVDDNNDAADSLAAVLRLLKHEVAIAYDGKAALDVAETFKPEVAVIDIGLPEMNGYELAARIRAQSAFAPPLLIALTGYGQQEDRERAYAAGFAHHITKPADLEKLQHLLADLDASEVR